LPNGRFANCQAAARFPRFPGAWPGTPPANAAARMLGATFVSLAAAAVSASGALSPTLSIEEAIAGGVAAHPLVLRARAGTDVERARRVGAALWLPANPWASVLVGKRSEPAGTGVEAVAHLEQSLEVAGQRGTRLRSVDAAVRTAVLRER